LKSTTKWVLLEPGTESKARALENVKVCCHEIQNNVK